MAVKRNTGRTGSASTDTIDGDKITFTLNEVAYLVSKAESIERMYNFLNRLHEYHQNTGHYKSLQTLCKTYNISYHIIGILQRNDIITKEQWIWRNGALPTKFLAIQAQLWYRNYFAQKKIK